jgi:DNA-binding NarL/FixJ family response regulator
MGRCRVIRVMLADDQPLVRAGFRMLLEVEDDIEVVGEADDGEAALQLISTLAPDVVLMDIRMPGVDGLEALRRMSGDDAMSATKVLVLTTFELDEYVFAALRLGASGFLLKHTKPGDLVRAVREIVAGEALLSPSVTRRLIQEFTARPTRPELTPPTMSTVTDREVEVVALVAQGLTNDEIAAELYLRPATARTHVSRAMVKLHARDRAQLVVFAYQSGLIRPPTQREASPRDDHAGHSGAR